MKEKETLFRKVEKSEGVADAFYIHHLGFVKPVTGYFFTEEEMAEHNKKLDDIDMELCFLEDRIKGSDGDKITELRGMLPPHQVNSEK